MIFVIYECEEKIGYTFKDKLLLRMCFTHSSYSHEHGGKNNERLEFFGDSVLGFVVTEYLFEKFPDKEEGELTEYKQQMVSRKPLAKAIVRLGLNDYIMYGEGESKNTAEHHEAACENLYEALVAGIYIDGGEDEARKFIKRTLISSVRLEDKNSKTSTKISDSKVVNYKGKLQEYVQKYKLGFIEYKEISKSGSDHDPTFTVSVSINGEQKATAIGKKKSEAEQSAAKTALNAIEKKGGDKKSSSKKPNAVKAKKAMSMNGKSGTEANNGTNGKTKRKNGDDKRFVKNKNKNIKAVKKERREIN